MPRPLQEARSEASMAKVLDAALELYSTQGFGATSMRQIAEVAGVSVGNVYHHFSNKETIFQRLIDRYWELLLAPDLRLNRVFAAARFPDDLEELAEAIEEVVARSEPYIMLIYIDVIEFRGEHIRTFYEGMSARFERMYGPKFAERMAAGELGDVDPMVAVMVAVRWLFYFFTVERCFGVPMHFGMEPRLAVEQFIRIVRYGVLPRGGGSQATSARNHGAEVPGGG